MSDRLRERLERAARDPRRALDTSAIARRARRLAWTHRAMAAVAAAALVSGGYVMAEEIDEDPPRPAAGPTNCSSLDFDVAVFLTDEATDGEIAALVDEIRTTEDVESVTFFSKSDAYVEFKEVYRDQPEVWENLPPDALPASIRIKISSSVTPRSVAVQLPHASAVDAISIASLGRDAGPADGCPDIDYEEVWRPDGSNETRPPEQTSPIVTIAGGHERGRPWSLSVYTAWYEEQPDQQPDALCVDWKFGPAPHSGSSCYPGWSEKPDSAYYFLRSADPSAGALFGAVSREVASVELRLPDGTAKEARIYEPPPELGLDFNFFVGFLGSGKGEDRTAGVTVVVLNDSGEALAEETF
jgi:hypothetical protein